MWRITHSCLFVETEASPVSDDPANFPTRYQFYITGFSLSLWWSHWVESSISLRRRFFMACRSYWRPYSCLNWFLRWSSFFSRNLSVVREFTGLADLAVALHLEFALELFLLFLLVLLVFDVDRFLLGTVKSFLFPSCDWEVLLPRELLLFLFTFLISWEFYLCILMLTRGLRKVNDPASAKFSCRWCLLLGCLPPTLTKCGLSTCSWIAWWWCRLISSLSLYFRVVGGRLEELFFWFWISVVMSSGLSSWPSLSDVYEPA